MSSQHEVDVWTQGPHTNWQFGCRQQVFTSSLWKLQPQDWVVHPWQIADAVAFGTTRLSSRSASKSKTRKFVTFPRSC